MGLPHYEKLQTGFTEWNINREAHHTFTCSYGLKMHQYMDVMIITCKTSDNNPELEHLVNRQIHRHCQTCHKKSKAECRFNFPQPPTKSTSILHPLIRKHKDSWKNISKHLNDTKEGQDISFDQLLTNLNISEQNYYLAICSSLNSPTIFLKRNPNELRVNYY